ncbi:MAG: UDP-N-acetylmuramoyl-L-alanyl-D-glutamate--2,6-diaminopimelate ligase [Rickettsiales bacterium]|jgi:UDP-N-acetylmuramoyl-L-alanyl-D-glutamate--2,6-diaminopimelate ligase|nr:UDP-N-acetylmuramoyl-L-alanyl-D-glutamate--2,6-diaminopimelate ligase [Rickettsiales bacterium]
MLFSEILEKSQISSSDFRDVEISSLETDSRIVGPGSVFVALDGRTNRGLDFVPEAIERGARAIVVDERYSYRDDRVTIISVKNPREELVRMLKKFFNGEFPEHMMAVTGTQGKTSVVEFIRQIMAGLGYSCASIGTLGLICGTERIKENTLTMPEIVDLYRTLNSLKKRSVDFLSMEVTSQGLDTNRFDGIKVQMAGVTNIYNHEHLDHHGSIENYFACKMKLFQEHCLEGATVVLNPDSNFYGAMRSICEDRNYRVLTFGHSASADVRILESTAAANGLEQIEFRAFGRVYRTNTRLFGGFQAINLMNALTFVYGLALDRSLDEIVETLETVEAAEGRMKFVAETRKGGRVYIDYAHTPSAFEIVLGVVREHLRKIGNGKLLCLFGAGGDRDRTKRPLMGKVAQELSDIVILADDNPRTEDPEAIRADILSGCDGNGNPVHNFRGSREGAIEFALGLLGKDDILLVLGKGHENYQLTREGKHHFSETEIILRNI